MADGVFTGGLSGVAFGPGVSLISRVTQGCQPIGPSRNTTRAERNFVVSLDGKPALDCVLQDLGLDRDLSDHELSQALSNTLVGLITAAEDVPTRPGQFGADTIVRHLVGGGPHFGTRHAELQVVRNALGDVPLVGFFAGGEIARHHLYGYTGVLTVFTAPA